MESGRESGTAYGCLQSAAVALIPFQNASSITATERDLLAALIQQIGPGAPTLCEGWTVRHLLVHLVIREGDPLSLLGSVPALRSTIGRRAPRRPNREFADLVQTLRHGPALLSPFRVPLLGPALNLGEYFVHHEDVRRAQPDWAPRDLPAATEDVLWRGLKLTARGLVSKVPVGLVVERTDAPGTRRLRSGEASVVVRGKPSELLLYLFGRRDHALVELVGDDEALEALRSARLAV